MRGSTGEREHHSNALVVYADLMLEMSGVNKRKQTFALFLHAFRPS